MINVNHHHLCRATRCATRFNGTSSPVTNFQKAHQSRRSAAARKFFTFATKRREVRASARTILKQTRFAHPQVHDPAFIHQIIRNRLNKASMRLRMLISRFRFGQFASFMVNIMMPLRWAINAISPMQTSVKPLRRIRRTFLRGQHEALLVIKCESIFLSVEIFALPAPISPSPSKAVEHFLCAVLTCRALLQRQMRHCFIISNRAPQPRWNGFFLNALENLGHTGLAEILLRENVCCHLAPCGRNFNVI